MAEEVPLGVAILGVEVRSEAAVAVRDSKRLRVKMQALGCFPALFLWGTLRYFHHILLHLLRGTTIFPDLSAFLGVQKITIDLQ